MVPSEITDTVSFFWLATTARFVPGSTATATGPERTTDGTEVVSVSRLGVEGSITESVLVVGFTVTATLVSGLKAPAILPVSTGPLLAPAKVTDETVWSSRLKNETTPRDIPFGDGSTSTACCVSGLMPIP